LSFAREGQLLLCGCGDGDLYGVRLKDFRTQAFEVQDGDWKAPLTRVWTHVLEDSRTLAAHAFEKQGWGFSLLDPQSREGP